MPTTPSWTPSRTWQEIRQRIQEALPYQVTSFSESRAVLLIQNGHQDLVEINKRWPSPHASLSALSTPYALPPALVVALVLALALGIALTLALVR